MGIQNVKNHLTLRTASVLCLGLVMGCSTPSSTPCAQDNQVASADTAPVGGGGGGGGNTGDSVATTTNPPAPPDKAALMDLLQRMDGRRFFVQSLFAKLGVVVRDVQTGKETGLEGYYFGDAKGNLRMIVKWQETTVVDLAFTGEEVTLYLPRDEKLYKGKRKDLEDSQASALSLLANAGHIHDLFFPRAWTPHAVGRRLCHVDKDDVIRVFEMDNPQDSKEEPRLARQIYLSKKAPAAEMVEVLDCKRQPQGNIRYAQFKELKLEKEGETPVPLTYPAQVLLTPSKGSHALQMDVRELELNREIPETKYHVSNLPEELKTQPLSDFLKNGKGMW